MESPAPEQLVVQDVSVRYTYGGRLFRLTLGFPSPDGRALPPCEPNHPWPKSLYFDPDEMLVARNALGENRSLRIRPDGTGRHPELPPDVQIEEVTPERGFVPNPVGPYTLCWHHCGSMWICCVP